MSAMKTNGVNEWDDYAGMWAPCQPIGCDADIHLKGCVYAPTMVEADPEDDEPAGGSTLNREEQD